jgi:hypothetical protein
MTRQQIHRANIERYLNESRPVSGGCCGTSAVGIACSATSNSSGTYIGTSSDGTDVYYTSSGSYVDQNGNALTSAQIASAQAQETDTPPASPGTTATPAQSTLHTPAPGPTVNSPGSGGASMSGIGTIFGAIGSAFGTAVNPPKTVAGVNLVYNPATGQYAPAGGTGTTAMTSLTTYLIIGAVAVGLLFVIMAEKG